MDQISPLVYISGHSRDLFSEMVILVSIEKNENYCEFILRYKVLSNLKNNTLTYKRC